MAQYVKVANGKAVFLKGCDTKVPEKGDFFSEIISDNCPDKRAAHTRDFRNGIKLAAGRAKKEKAIVPAKEKKAHKEKKKK